MLSEITAGVVHTWLLVALAVAAGIVAIVAVVGVMRGSGERPERRRLATAAPSGSAWARHDDEERDDDD